jgi:hypothetical protein
MSLNPAKNKKKKQKAVQIDPSLELLKEKGNAAFNLVSFHLFLKFRWFSMSGHGISRMIFKLRFT